MILRIALLLWLVAGLLQGCGPSWSPVENRPGANDSYVLTPDGRYRVRRGDSLYTIAFRFGLDWRDLAKWNGIHSPYTIYPKQELRLSPPPSRSSSEVVTRPARSPAATVSTDQRVAEPDLRAAPDSAVTKPVSPAPDPEPVAEVVESRVPPPASVSGGWMWPTEGRLLSTFKANDPTRNGIEIGGSEGQPIVAAAAGEVVYSGSGLIGYGELIIVKHSDRMLSAYAHNRKRLVSEGQTVATGELLAEMGRDDRNKPMLHFEIRVNGTPQDPLKFLPSR